MKYMYIMSYYYLLIVQTLLPNKAEFIEGDPGEDTPMHVVGAFLSALYDNFELSTHSLTLKRCRTPSMASKALSNQSTHILHSCQGFSQSQLIRLIISVYGGVPEPFEVLHCQPSTTEEELRLFLSPKRATKRPFQYLILEVNNLPYQLQEVTNCYICLLYTSPSPRDATLSRMPSSA